MKKLDTERKKRELKVNAEKEEGRGGTWKKVVRNKVEAVVEKTLQKIGRCHVRSDDTS